MFFSIGGAAASTMVTAILPTVTAPPSKNPLERRQSRVGQVFGSNGHVSRPSVESEVTITPARFVSRHTRRRSDRIVLPKNQDLIRSTSRVAGLVGMATGCGALIALIVFLPLPAKFQYAGVGEKDALKDAFYIVAVVAFLLSICCLFGLRHLQGEAITIDSNSAASQDESRIRRFITPLRQSLDSFRTAIFAGFSHPDIAIGYLGGFVARASSVGISLFIPLLINAMFLSSGLCDVKGAGDDPSGLPDIKRKCPKAYLVAAALTGITETVALVFAPIFGYWGAKTSRNEIPLLFASVAGVIGYPLFANEFDPDGEKVSQRVIAFVAASLIGVSQIGAIVCSLATLSKGVLMSSAQESPSSPDREPQENGTSQEDEAEPLLPNAEVLQRHASLSELKGSVAGVYSLYGGAAILILTKLGGLLFDKVSLAAPFYIMAAFNAILVVACVVSGIWKHRVTTNSELSEGAPRG